MDKKALDTVTQIKIKTENASHLMDEGRFDEALSSYKLICSQASNLSDANLLMTAMVNLTAAAIAQNEPQTALDILQIENVFTNSSIIRAELYFNFGVLYEILSNNQEATKYYELAYKEYKLFPNTSELQVKSLVKAGTLYDLQKGYIAAARVYSIAAELCDQTPDLLMYCKCLLHKAKHLAKASLDDEALKVADDCGIAFQKLPQDENLVFLYNELGLLYSKCGDYSCATLCFELALPLCKKKEEECILRQNLGAAFDALFDFQNAALNYKYAAKLFSEIREGHSEGLCRAGMAYTCTQLGDMQGANENYQQAYEKACEAHDLRLSYQAAEGLGCIHLCCGETEAAHKWLSVALHSAKQLGNMEVILRIEDKLKYCFSPDNKKFLQTVPTSAAASVSGPQIRQNELQLTRRLSKRSHALQALLPEGEVYKVVPRTLLRTSTDDSTFKAHPARVKKENLQITKPTNDSTARDESLKQHIRVTKTDIIQRLAQVDASSESSRDSHHTPKPIGILTREIPTPGKSKQELTKTKEFKTKEYAGENGETEDDGETDTGESSEEETDSENSVNSETDDSEAVKYMMKKHLDKVEGTDGSETGSQTDESDSNDTVDGDETSNQRNKPALPTQLPLPTVPIVNTYEEPLRQADVATSTEHQEDGMATYASLHPPTSSVPVKQQAPSESSQPNMSKSDVQPPPLPDRPNSLSRAQEEMYLRELHIKDCEKRMQGQQSQVKETTRVCSLM